MPETAKVPTAKPYKLRPRVWGAILDDWRIEPKPGDQIEVVTRRGKRWITTVERVLPRKEYAGTDETGAEVFRAIVATAPRDGAPAMTTRERKAAKVEKRREWAEGRDAKSTAEFKKARQAVAGIPLGQPILVGHHSEKRHRRALDRQDGALRRGVESADMAEHHRNVADGIERQLETSIYSDDPDIVERLTAKLEGLEAERSRIKEINAALRKAAKAAGVAVRHGYRPSEEVIAAARDVIKAAGPALELKDAEIRSLGYGIAHHGRIGYPPYVLSNLGGTITRTRNRLARVKRDEGIT